MNKVVRTHPATIAPDFTRSQHPDALRLVDPELRSTARLLQEQFAPLIFITDENIASVRSWVDSFTGTFHPDVPVVERWVAGVKRIPDVRIFLINARSGEQRPGILVTHAGGYIVGSARADVPRLQRIAAVLDCVIVAVEYRLAPEARYCDSLEDNYLALKWAYDNAAEIGLDQSRIAVMGASAGGGHAALLAITARDRGEVPLAFQLLVYPMLDDRTCTSRAIPEHIGSLIWTKESNRVGWRAFLGCEPGTNAVPAGAVPARTSDLSGLPPAFIGVGALDLFVGECIEYARRLICAGVQTELHIVPGAFHGFDFAEDADVAKRFRAANIQALARAFGVAVKPEADSEPL